MLPHLHTPYSVFRHIQNICAVGNAHPSIVIVSILLAFAPFALAFGQGTSNDPPQPTSTELASGYWQQRSPIGGDIADVAYSPVEPSVLLAAHVATVSATSGALYRSDDSGASWQRVPELGNAPVYDIEFSKTGGIVLGTLDGVVTSSDGGKVWQRRALGIGLNDAVLDVALDPLRPAVLWAGIADAQGTQPVNVMRSHDRGGSWSNRTPPLSRPLSCREIAIDPVDPRRIVAVFGGDFSGGEVWVSENDGLNWTQRSQRLPDRPLRTVAFAGERLLVGGGMRLAGQAFGVYASDDFGRSWAPLHDATWSSLAVESIAVAPDNAELILVATDGGGLRRSENGGRSWQQVSATQGQSLRSVRFDPVSSQRIALGRIADAIALSRDRGLTFATSAEGVHAMNVRAVAMHPFDERRLAIAANGVNTGAVYASSDRGLHWTRGTLPATRFNALAFDADGRLYAVSGGPSAVAAEGLYRRNADGSWTALGPDQGSAYETDIHSLRFGRYSPDTVVIAGSDVGAAGNEATVWISEDRGVHWRKSYESTGAGGVTDIELVEGEGAMRLLATFDDRSGARHGRVLRSDDAGATWQDASAGMPTVFSRSRLCINDSDPQTVYLAATSVNWTSRVYRSEDGGMSWRAMSAEGSSIVDIACDPGNAAVVYVSRQDASATGVERSRDGGASFQRMPAGAEDLFKAGELAVQPTADGSIAVFVVAARGSYLTRVDRLRN